MLATADEQVPAPAPILVPPVARTPAPPPTEAHKLSEAEIDRLMAAARLRPTGDDCWGHYSARMGDVACNGSRVKLITDPD